MKRKLASVVKISDVRPVENSDRLSVAKMAGKSWEVVVGRDDFKVGDMAVYFEIDSYLPNEERYAFLRERCLRKFCANDGTVLREGLRIKTVKLRGVISQGLLIPLDKFPEIDEGVEYAERLEPTLTYSVASMSDEGVERVLVNVTVPLEGADVTDMLNVEHYDEVAADCGAKSTAKSVADPNCAGAFPCFVPRTDEERIQNLESYFSDPDMVDKTFEVTEKNDGSSMTVLYSLTYRCEDPFAVCSRRLEVKQDGDSEFAKAARKLGLRDKIEKYCEDNKVELAFQGELVGPRLNGNRDKYDDVEWHVFRIWDIKNQKFMLPSKRRALCEKLGLQHVPVIDESMKVFQRFHSGAELLKFAEGKTARGNEREGVVFKENVEDDPVTFKAVSNRYLLKHSD